MAEKKPIPVRLGEDIILRLDAAANRMGTNRAAVIRFLTQGFLEHFEKNGGVASLPHNWEEILRSLDGRAFGQQQSANRVPVDPDLLRDKREVTCFGDLVEAGLAVGVAPNNEADTVVVPASWKKPVDFVARIGGDSAKRYVEDGEYAAFTWLNGQRPKSGSMVLARVKGINMLKRFLIEGNSATLSALNPRYKEIIPVTRHVDIIALCHGLFPHPKNPPKRRS